MNSRVIKLADLNNCPVGEELFDVSISEEIIDEIIASKANEFGTVKALDVVSDGCVAVCKNESGKKVLIYPGLGISVAAKAEADVMGKKVGDVVETELNESSITLTITEILTNVPSEVNDELAKKVGIDGVTTLDELKESIRAEQTEKKQTENMRSLMMLYNDYLVKESEVEIDADEEKEWSLKIARSQFEENLSMGIDLRFTEEGDMLTDDEVLEMLAKDVAAQFRSTLVNRKFCDENGFVPDDAMIETEAKSQAEMSGITEEDKIQELISILTENAYFGFVFSKLEEKAKEVLA